MSLWENMELSFQESGTVTICDILQVLVLSYFQGSQSSTWEDLVNALFIWVIDIWSLTLRYSTAHFLSFFLFFFKFIYLWLCWVFISVRGFSLAVASGGHSSSPCAGLSLSWPLLLWSTGSRCAGSVVVAHGPTCSAACGIFPDQGSNLCLLH